MFKKLTFALALLCAHNAVYSMNSQGFQSSKQKRLAAKAKETESDRSFKALVRVNDAKNMNSIGRPIMFAGCLLCCVGASCASIPAAKSAIGFGALACCLGGYCSINCIDEETQRRAQRTIAPRTTYMNHKK